MTCSLFIRSAGWWITAAVVHYRAVMVDILALTVVVVASFTSYSTEGSRCLFSKQKRAEMHVFWQQRFFYYEKYPRSHVTT